MSSLSAILLNEDYYALLLEGKTVIDGLSVLKPEYLLLFKAKAFLDLRERKAGGEHVDSRDIRKHKTDILRIAAEFSLEKPVLSESVHMDMEHFLNILNEEPFDSSLLKEYGLTNEEVCSLLRQVCL